MTVLETPGFLRDAAAAMTDEERTEAIYFLAASPDSDDVMPDTGGGRKLRWRARGRGKRGGVRIICYFHNESLPLFLLSVFAKNEKADLTKAERNEMKSLLPRLVAATEKGWRHDKESRYEATDTEGWQSDHRQPEGSCRMGRRQGCCSSHHHGECARDRRSCNAQESGPESGRVCGEIRVPSVYA